LKKPRAHTIEVDDLAHLSSRRLGVNGIVPTIAAYWNHGGACRRVHSGQGLQSVYKLLFEGVACLDGNIQLSKIEISREYAGLAKASVNMNELLETANKKEGSNQ
jgi:hypothetical protein